MNVEELRKARCADPNCANPDCSLVLFAKCHPRQGTVTSYNRKTHTLRIECAVCHVVHLESPYTVHGGDRRDTTVAEMTSDEKPMADEVIADGQELKGNLDAMAGAMASLPERERAIMRRRFFDGASLREIGDEMGFSRERARQLEAKALERMREAMGI